MRIPTHSLFASWLLLAALGCEGGCGQAPLGCAQTLWLGQVGEPGLLAAAEATVGPSDTNENLCSNEFANALEPEIAARATDLELWGYAPPPGESAGPMSPAPLFVARGGFDRESSRAELEARCALSCAGMHPWAHEAFIRELVSGAPAPNSAALGVGVGMVYDMRSFYPEQPDPDVRAAGFPVAAEGPRPEDAGVVLSGDVIDWPFDEVEHRCWAVFLAGAVAGRQAICVDPDEPIVPYLEAGRRAVVWGWLEQHDPGHPPGEGYFVGLVRNLDNNDPIELATVAAPDGARVLYPDFGEEWSPDALARPETGAQGVFIVRGPFVGAISVDHSAFAPVGLRVAVLPEFVGSRVIALAPDR